MRSIVPLARVGRALAGIVLLGLLLGHPAGAWAGVSGLQATEENATKEREAALRSASGSGEGSVSANTKAAVYTVGAWVQTLNDFNVQERLFGATVWLWAIGPAEVEGDPLRTLQPTNLVGINESNFSGNAVRGEKHWFEKKVQGQFRHMWNLQNFPFDKQVLKMRFTEGLNDTFALKYVVDKRGSRLSDTIDIPGWRVSDFTVTAVPVEYNTSFGDPASVFDNRTARPALEISIELVRTTISGFFKLTAIMYGCVLLTCLTFLMAPADVSPRGSFVAGSLFATALNMRAASSALGTDGTLTLVDQLHILSLVLVFIAALMIIVTRRLLDRSMPLANVMRVNVIVLGASLVGFVIGNVILIGQAAALAHAP